MSKIMETVKEIVQAAVAAFDAPPESFAVVDEYGNEWTYVKERTCQWHCLDRLDLPDGTSVIAYETECGGKQTWWPEGLPNYCPNCSGRVVD